MHVLKKSNLDRAIIKQIIITCTILLCLIILAFFIKIPYNINCSGKILPAREWIIRSVNGGDIVSIFNNHTNSPIYEFTDFKFERGEIANFSFKKKFDEKSSVKKNDTIGYISSYLLDEKISQLKNALSEEQANLLALNAGEKNSLVEASKNQFVLAQQEFELQEKNYQRQRKLYEKEVIPAAEYDISLKDYELAKTNIELAKNNLLAIQTGEKPELINFSNVRINSIENELKLLKKKQDLYTLISPFNGKIITKKVAMNNPEALTYHILHVIDTSEYVVLLPVELNQRKFISKEIKIKATILEGENIEDGLYIGEDQDVEMTGNYKQVFIIKGTLKSVTKEIPYGIYADCTINCGNVSLLDYIIRKLKI